MTPRFATARFHVRSGPDALFTRVRHIMGVPASLRTGRHALERLAGRHAPTGRLVEFDPDTWELVSADVRTDTGKWVKSTWSVDVDGRRWWVVIGLGSTVVTVIDVAPERVGLGDGIITDGPLYEFVAGVNAKLMG
ncbi:hypothetical protein ACFCX0_06430 [Streptomyces sp. NPDC056352]|uniref:hypothetical protein n=1 Tax=Streptomyces sp. NPDC056352 TaxID=3345791 RepID=UPI0035DBE4B7